MSKYKTYKWQIDFTAGSDFQEQIGVDVIQSMLNVLQVSLEEKHKKNEVNVLDMWRFESPNK